MGHARQAAPNRIFDTGRSQPSFLRLNTRNRVAAMSSMIAMEAMNPEFSPNPGYGTFCPKNPVTAVGTATIATQAVIRRMSSFCCTEVPLRCSAAMVMWGAGPGLEELDDP